MVLTMFLQGCPTTTPHKLLATEKLVVKQQTELNPHETQV